MDRTGSMSSSMPPTPTPARPSRSARWRSERGFGATVWGEKAMFRWGQRRRAAGRRWPFGLPALIMGALAIVGNLAEPPKA